MLFLFRRPRWYVFTFLRSADPAGDLAAADRRSE